MSIIDQFLTFLAENPSWIIFISLFLPLGGLALISTGVLDPFIGESGKHQRVKTSVAVQMITPVRVEGNKFDFEKITHYYNTV